MFDREVNSFVGGVTNSRNTDIFSDMPMNKRWLIHEYVQPFDQFIAGDWTVFQNNGGTVTLTAANMGNLTLANSAAINDYVGLQKNPTSWNLALNRRTWYTGTANVDSPLANGLTGLANAFAGGNPFTAGTITDGIYFSQVAGVVQINVAVNSVVTSVALPVVPSTNSENLAQSAQFSFYWDGALYAAAPNGRIIAESYGGGLVPTRVIVPAPAGFPRSTVPLAPFAALQNSTAAARTAVLDLLYVAQDRLNPYSSNTYPF